MIKNSIEEDTSESLISTVATVMRSTVSLSKYYKIPLMNVIIHIHSSVIGLEFIQLFIAYPDLGTVGLVISHPNGFHYD